MGATAITKKPRPGDKKRPTTLSLDPRVWEWLKAIERETGAKPSVVAGRILLKAIAKEGKAS